MITECAACGREIEESTCEKLGLPPLNCFCSACYQQELNAIEAEESGYAGEVAEYGDSRGQDDCDRVQRIESNMCDVSYQNDVRGFSDGPDW